MKKLAQYLLAFSLLLLAENAALAQESNIFYRGRQDSGYNLLYNGHCWWENATFKSGSVLYNGRLYNDILLNINAHTSEALLLRPSEIVPVVLETGMVRWLAMNDELFLNLKLIGVENATEGYYKLVQDGPAPVFARVFKSIRSGTANVDGDLIGYKDPNYRNDVYTFFERTAVVYMLRDGSLVPFRNRSSVKSYCDREQKRVLRKAVRNMGVRAKDLPLEKYVSILADVIAPKGRSPLEINPHGFAMPDMVQPGSVIDPMSDAIVSKPENIDSEWFQDEGIEGTVRYVSGVPVLAVYRNKVYELGIKNRKTRGPVIIQGVVTDSEDHKPVVGAVVYEKITGNYTTTDNFGVWALEVPLGETVITFSETAMEDFPVMVTVYDRARLDVLMSPKSEMLNGVTISADARAAHRTPRMGVEKLSLKAISRVPSAFGEGDILKAMQSLPGVQSVGEASNGINVRGGSADQNLILYNGSTIYNSTHMFGLFSAFDPSMVGNVELYKSSIPAEYGGRLSSVMDVRGRDGNFEKFKGDLGLGVLTSHLTVDTPIGKKKKTSLIAGGRTTYANYILGLLPANSSYKGGNASFSDLSARLTHKLSDDNVIRGNVYWSKDSFGFSGDTTFRYSNLNASLQWERKISKKLSAYATAAYDDFKANMLDMHDVYESFSHTVGVNQISGRCGLLFNPLPAHSLNFGVEFVRLSINPGKLDPVDWDPKDIKIEDENGGDILDVHSQVAARILDKETGIQSSFWLSDTWTPISELTVDGGVRLTSFSNTGGRGSYSYPEFRLSAKYSSGENLSFKAGFNTMTQYIHLISNTTSISPMDTWKLSDMSIKPQTGWQGAGGAYLTCFGGMLDLSAETYFKRSFGGLDYKSGSSLFMNSNIAAAVVQTTGKAYGLELMAKKTSGTLSGWVSYTYSRSFLQEVGNRGLSAINGGEWYRAPYDKPHSLQLVGNYEFTHRYSLSFNLDYSTGRPVTIPIGHYFYENSYHLLYSDRNAYRIPDYFRLDLALNVEPGHRLTKLTHFSCTFGVYNVTGRKNAYSVYYTTMGTNVNGHMVSIFAVPIPYASINMKF